MKAIIDIPQKENAALNILKSQMGFRNKSETITFLVRRFREQEMEPQLRPEYAQKILKDENKKGYKFKSLEELRSRYV